MIQPIRAKSFALSFLTAILVPCSVQAITFPKMPTLPQRTEKPPFEQLSDRKYDKAASGFQDSLETARAAGDAAGMQRLRLLIDCTRLASDDAADQRKAFDDVREPGSPDALVQADFASGVALWGLGLIARSEAVDVQGEKFRTYEAACRAAGPMGAEVASGLTGLGLAFEAAGYGDAARRLFAVAGARCGDDPSAALARATSTFDLTLFGTAPWGTVPLDRAQSESMRAILERAPNTFAAAIARYAVDESKTGTRLPLPRQLRTAILTRQMASFGELDERYFTSAGGQWRQPKGRFSLLPACRVNDGSGLGTLLLPPKDDPSANDLQRTCVAGDLLARAELMRRGVHTGGVTIEKSGKTLMENVQRGIGGFHIPGAPKLPPIPIGPLLEGIDKVGDLLNNTPDSLILANPLVLSLMGKEATNFIDKTLGKELYTNPRIPYMDWAAREAETGIGLSADVNADRSWAVSEFWRASNIKKYAALNAIARNDRTLGPEDRARIRQQMTLWWEMIVADQRTHLGEDGVDLLTGRSVAEIGAQLDTIAAREREFQTTHDRIEKITDSPELRKQRETFVDASLEQARQVELGELTTVFPAGTLVLTLSTNERNTSVLASLVPDAGGKATFIGHVLFGLGRQRLVTQVDALIDAVQDSSTGESQALEQGRALFEALFSKPSILDLITRSRRIVFVPNGVAGDIPFNALAWQVDGRLQFLGLTRPVTVDESVAMIRWIESAPHDTSVFSQSLIVGAPTRHLFEDPFSRTPEPTPRFQLAGARDEAKSLGVLYASTPILEGAADEASVRGRVARARLIHIASHGYAPSSESIRSPLAAGIWLASTCDDSYQCDGVLQAWEIVTQMDLGADLVVFSGCSTGRLWSQFGTVGELARSTLYAGARSVIVSQWSVDDAATRTFMTDFHTRLRKGVARDQALQETMIALHDARATRHPTYWAAFRCLGVGWE